MDFSFQVQTMITHIVALMFLICYLWRKLISPKRSHDSTKISPPEPSGAWPLIGHLHLLNSRHDPACKVLGAFADKHGPIFSLRLGIHRILVVTGHEIVSDIVTNNDKILSNRANIVAGRYIGYNNAIFALGPYGQYWRDVRKLATLKLLSSHRIEELRHVRMAEVDMFVKDLYKFCMENNNWNATKIALNKLFESLTFNLSLRMIVGKRYSSERYREEDSEAGRYKKAIEEALYLFGTFVIADAIPWMEWVDFKRHVSAMKRTAKKLDAVIETWLEEHMRKRLEGEGNDRESDFMDVMISNLADGSLISEHSRDVVIKATTLILTLTGAGSTAVTLTWAVSLLLNHPKVLKAAQEELNNVVGKQRWVQESDIENLKYLQAIVKETLRLYPPGPLTGIREAIEDCCIGGYHMPKGTRLVVNIWKLHRDPSVWENPGEFRPERFMRTHDCGGDDGDGKGNHKNFEYIPFGFGRRSCPASNLGLQVVHFSLARVLQGFDLMTVNGFPVDMKEGLGLSLPKLNPLEVFLSPRLGFHLYQCL